MSKIAKAQKMAKVHQGPVTLSDITSRIPADVFKECPARLLAKIMEAIDGAYHDGKASAGAEMIDTNCVYINSINKAIEWTEVGAEYETVTEIVPYNEHGPGYTSTKQVKVKSGELVVNFSE